MQLKKKLLKITMKFTQKLLFKLTNTVYFTKKILVEENEEKKINFQTYTFLFSLEFGKLDPNEEFFKLLGKHISNKNILEEFLKIVLYKFFFIVIASKKYFFEITPKNIFIKFNKNKLIFLFKVDFSIPMLITYLSIYLADLALKIKKIIHARNKRKYFLNLFNKEKENKNDYDDLKAYLRTF